MRSILKSQRNRLWGELANGNAFAIAAYGFTRPCRIHFQGRMKPLVAFVN
jgi:hypothetical protein